MGDLAGPICLSRPPAFFHPCAYLRKTGVLTHGGAPGRHGGSGARPGPAATTGGGLAAFTGMTGVELGLTALPAAAGRPAPDEEDAETKRREMISTMVAAGAALSGFPLAPRDAVPDRIGPADIAEVRRLTGMYRHMAYRREKVARWEAGVEPEMPAQLAMAALHGVDPVEVAARGWPSWLMLALPGPDIRAPFTPEVALSALTTWPPAPPARTAPTPRSCRRPC